MDSDTANLEIRIHRVDGTTSSFAQDELELSGKILEGLDPEKIFARPRIILGDRSSHTVIPVNQITRVDLDINPNCPLTFPVDLVEAVELMPREFETLVENLAAHDQWNNLGELDGFVVTFLNLEMGDGLSVLLTMEVDSVSPQGLCELRDFLLSRPALCFRASGGGVAILNLGNLACLTIFPGASHPEADTWQVRRSDERQPANPDDRLIAEIATGPCPPSPRKPMPTPALRIKRL